MFGRRNKKRGSEPAQGATEDAASSSTGDAADGDTSGATAGGPWDSDQDVPEQQRIDFGSLRIPVGPDVGVSWEFDKSRKRIAAIRVIAEKSIVRIQAFAAPKSQGLWEEAREGLVAGLSRRGGRSKVVEGPLGPELRAVVPVPDKKDDQGRSLVQPARYVGVDGPRWMLRVDIHGAAAIQPDSAAAARIEEILRGIVVVRGTGPKPPREALELRLSSQTQELVERARQRAAEQQAQADETADTVDTDETVDTGGTGDEPAPSEASRGNSD
ncbi:DUF3710 domain-containing protein [Spiractinospora alimapuensis]|uniref:DUF3710 domain-containing protein n=1 Tax=Spiractinospora alimapuensis TaxID=2820884 RepID=UPI001F162DB5|nr:DUF3710 domain-containing protein [Spiractinospora alimapuensis]QVQ52386.1 DUF3710 domain-containing protein [Spiractinospora alimapuensis]